MSEDKTPKAPKIKGAQISIETRTLLRQRTEERDIDFYKTVLNESTTLRTIAKKFTPEEFSEVTWDGNTITIFGDKEYKYTTIVRNSVHLKAIVNIQSPQDHTTTTFYFILEEIERCRGRIINILTKDPGSKF